MFRRAYCENVHDARARAGRGSRGFLALFAALALWCAVPRPALAQTAEAAGVTPVTPDLSDTTRVLLFAGAALSLLPASAGVDAPVGARGVDSPRFVLGWPFQIPLRLAGERVSTATYANHRVVLTPALAFGAQYGPARGAERERADVTFTARVGYRYVAHPDRGAFGVLVGVGTTLEFWPDVRPSFSPELGLHLGACCGDASALVTVVLRADAWFAGDNPVRLGAHAGWAFY